MNARAFLAAIAFLALPAAAQTVTPAASADCPTDRIICVSKAYRSVEETASLSPVSKQQPDHEAVEKLGVTILFVDSDVVQYWNPKPENKFCAASGCIYFAKECVPQRGAAMPGIGHCTYKMGNYEPAYGPGMVPLGREVLHPGNMEIGYATTDALKQAEQNIFVGLEDSGHKTFVPLSDVKTVADGQ